MLRTKVIWKIIIEQDKKTNKYEPSIVCNRLKKYQFFPKNLSKPINSFFFGFSKKYKNDTLETLGNYIIKFSDFVWGYPLLILLMGGGLYFLTYSQFIPFRYLGHAVALLRGKYDNPNESGQISHFEALASALAATIGMGNISGVAVAIVTGGPGALFWMWMCAIVGMATKFFECTLAVMYRKENSKGEPQGGPMYFISIGLGEKWKPMAYFFCMAGIFGALPILQANQLTQGIRDIILIKNGYPAEYAFEASVGIGIGITILVSMIIFGGIQRIASVASKLVPAMVFIYVSAVLYILLRHITEIPACFALILSDAFSGQAVAGGVVGIVIIQGVRRAAFSNEAGIGTSPMMHGAVKTNEPVREGLVAMLEPLIDTIIVCTMTALAILITGVWKLKGVDGITLTGKAFEQDMPYFGEYILMLCAAIFALTTLFSYSYYGTKCLGFLLGEKYAFLYNYFYIVSILFGSVATIKVALSLIDAMYALMAIPTVTSCVLLSPKVMAEAKKYFKKLKESR